VASKKTSDGQGTVYRRHKPDCPHKGDANAKCKCPWQGVLVTGWTVDKKPIRKKVTAQSKTAAHSKLRELRERVENGHLPKGRVPNVAEWMTYWLENIAAERNRPSTLAAYATYVNRYIIPLLGPHRLDRLTPEHISAAWKSLATEGCPGKANPKPLSPTSVHQAHVILTRALKVAQQRRTIIHNPATLMDAPTPADPDIEVLTKAQAQAVVEVARQHRNAARYTVAFSLGLRQGEALGMRWSDVDLETGRLHIRNALGRVTGKGLVLGPVKSKSGVRTFALPGPMLAELKAHRVAQNTERLAAGSWWHEGDYVFANEDGRPIDPKADWTTWRERLIEAGVPMVRLHAARHTAITMMLALGIKPQVVKEMAGHAKFSTTEGYIDKVDELHLDAAEKMAAFWD
jgi:integrase